MTKRKYTHVKEIESVIIFLREAGLTRQEIADGKLVITGFSAVRHARIQNKLGQFIMQKSFLILHIIYFVQK